MVWVWWLFNPLSKPGYQFPTVYSIYADKDNLNLNLNLILNPKVFNSLQCETRKSSKFSNLKPESIKCSTFCLKNTNHILSIGCILIQLSARKWILKCQAVPLIEMYDFRLHALQHWPFFRLISLFHFFIKNTSLTTGLTLQAKIYREAKTLSQAS